MKYKVTPINDGNWQAVFVMSMLCQIVCVKTTYPFEMQGCLSRDVV